MKRLTVMVAWWVVLAVGVGAGCTLDGFMFNGLVQDGPYDFSGTLIPSDRFDAEGTFVTAADGSQVHLHFVRSNGDVPSRADTTIFYCHGNHHHLFHYWDRVEILHELGYQVLIFDYRSFGRSEDADPTEAGLYADAEAAYDHLLSLPEVNPDRVVFYGYSLGGAPCIELAHRYSDQPAALVTEAVFRSVEDLLQDSAGASLHGSMGADLRFDNFAKISTVGAPVLLIHGRQDAFIPMESSVQLYERAVEPKALYLAPLGEHGNVPGEAGSAERQTYMEQLSTFLDSHLP